MVNHFTMQIARFKYYSLNLSSKLDSRLFNMSHSGPNQLQIHMGKYFSAKNIFCSLNQDKIGGERILEIVHCPFEGQADMHQ